MAGFLEYKHKQVMKDLFFLNTLRGKDSTGLTSVNRDRGILTRKLTVPGYEFIEYPMVEKAMTHADQLWIGHGRYKTTGDVTKANAHPFEVLDENGDVLLVGAHNGTLTNKYELERKLHNRKFDTDSEALFNWFTEAPNYKDAIALLRGAWSLVWWDPMEDAVHFCRNGERPLVFAFTKDRKVMMWASEAWMLYNAAKRNGVELLLNDKGLSIYSTNENTLYTMRIPQDRNKELPELEKEGGYTGAPVNNFQQKWTQVWGSDNDDWWEKRKKEEAEREKETKANGKEEPKVVHIGTPPGASIRGYNGESISLKKFDEIKSKGCVWCGDKFAQDKAFAFLNEDGLVCFNCLNDRHPKGDCVRCGNDDPFGDLDDPLPFDVPGEDYKGADQEDSPEYKKLVSASAAAAKKAVG